jgi:hypothetical protein
VPPKILKHPENIIAQETTDVEVNISGLHILMDLKVYT